jgi:hypothetical protein
MKNKFLKIGLPLMLLVIATLAIGSSCGSMTPDPTPTPVACSTTGTLFQQLFQQVKTAHPTFPDVTTMDLITHEYTFKVATNKTICSIGYQGNANLYAGSIAYTIEIYNNTTSALVYSGNHVFNSTAIDYKSITGVTLTAGSSYTIRRIASNYLGNIGNTVGRMLNFNAATGAFPATYGDLTISASNFYGSGGPVPNAGIPYIDIVFE